MKAKLFWRNSPQDCAKCIKGRKIIPECILTNEDFCITMTEVNIPPIEEIIVPPSIQKFYVFDSDGDNNVVLSLDDVINMTRKPINVGYICNKLTRDMKKKLTISELHLKWLNIDHDGTSSAEEAVFRTLYGPHERKWRCQREFYSFVISHENVEASTVMLAADAVFEAMELAGEDEETIERFRKIFVRPVIRKYLKERI